MKTKISLYFLITPLLMLAQINPKSKWGDVSQAEIDFKQVPFEKDAGAVILYEEGEMLITYTEWGNKIHKRIKILTEKGKEQANFKIIYFTYHNRENIVNFRAQTINFENGKKEISPVKMKDVYDLPHYGYYYARTFAFPNVKVGSIIELEYTLLNDNHNYLENWEFQHDIPTLYSSLAIDVQVPIDYVPICTGNKLQEFIKQNKNKKEYKTKWFLKDIPSFDKQDFRYNESDFGEKIDFQLKGYHHKTKGYVTEFAKWTDINSMIIKDNLKKNDESIVKNIASRISNENEENLQIKKVIEYFSKNYHWNEKTQAWIEQPLSEIENSRKGSTSELNYLLHNILRKKGINSELILICTRNHRKLQTAFPYLNSFSTIANLITLQDGTSFFIDAVHLPQYDYKFMPLRNYNHFGLILDAQKERFVTVNPPISEFYSTQNYSFKNGLYTLSRIDKSNGYFNNDRQPIEIINNSLESNFTEKSKTAPMLVEDKYKGTKTIYESQSAQSFYTIQNPLAKTINQFSFDQENREQPLEFNFPFYYKITTTVKVPEGYTAEIPQDFNTKHEVGNQDLIYYQKAEVIDETLIFSIEFLLGKSIFSNQYRDVKKFYEVSKLSSSQNILIKPK